MDFYERGLFNHILASQDPADRRCHLLLPAQARRVQDLLDARRLVLVLRRHGHGEPRASTRDTIYFHDDDALYVNLFIASELTWKEKGLTRPAGDALPGRGHDAR